MPDARLSSMPAWFLGHGAPLHLTGQQPVTHAWENLPSLLPRPPRALLCLSAHWLSTEPTLSGNTSQPSIQYDFHGFPEELYRFQWPLISDSQAAKWLQQDLSGRIENLQLEPERPLDHGVWVPLSRAWPAPDFPVYQLSLCPQLGAMWHVELGRSLASLRDEDTLVVGSGGIVHNLSRLNWHAAPGDASDWADEFMQAVAQAIQQNDIEALCHPWNFPHGRGCVPTIEHYLPLLVIVGMNQGKLLTPIIQDWEYGNLAMHSYSTS